MAKTKKPAESIEDKVKAGKSLTKSESIKYMVSLGATKKEAEHIIEINRLTAKGLTVD